MTPTAPSPWQTVRAVYVGYLPRVLQSRGWVLAAMPVAPVAAAVLVALLVEAQGGRVPPAEGLKIFHEAILKVLLPILVLFTAPVGIREDLEQRTLPLLLTRPAPVWILPFAKGMVWFSWVTLWLLLAALGLLVLGSGWEPVLRGALALVGVFWAELAFLTLLGLVFKRGALWGALYLFLWDPLVRVLPGSLQRFTFLHYAECISGSRASEMGIRDLLAQAPVETPVPLAVAILFLFGLACWAAAGWRLHATPVGLAGKEGEG